MQSHNHIVRNHSRGFTLIELIVVVAVAAVLSTVAVPSFEDFMTNQRLKRVSQAVMLDVLYARSEAIKLNAPTYVYPRDGDWNDGWLVTTVEDKTWDQCLADMTGCLRLTEAQDDNQVAMSGGPTEVIFGRMGRAGSPAAITVCDNPASSAADRRIVRVELTGHAAIAREGKCA